MPHLDVGGLQVTVNDALLVRGLESFGDLLRDGQRLVEWNGVALSDASTTPTARFFGYVRLQAEAHFSPPKVSGLTPTPVPPIPEPA